MMQSKVIIFNDYIQMLRIIILSKSAKHFSCIIIS